MNPDAGVIINHVERIQKSLREINNQQYKTCMCIIIILYLGE